MTKDYAKRRRMIHGARVRGHGRWISVAIVLGVIFGILYWRMNTNAQAPEIQPKLKASHTSLNNKVSKIAKEASARFDFYKVLPNMAAEIVEEPHSSPAVPARSPTPSPATHLTDQKVTPSEKYFIQVGSFKHLNQAEELKANLTLSGFDVRIQTVKIADTQTWYRVTIGPFNSKEKAQASSQKLQQTHALHSLILRIQV